MEDLPDSFRRELEAAIELLRRSGYPGSVTLIISRDKAGLERWSWSFSVAKPTKLLDPKALLVR